jgi:DNA (cytosine-5)-methyltransferase 1
MTLDITVTDMFCGAGGSTTGATQAGVNVVLAINHWAVAIETHNSNYPNVKHVLTDLHVANPRKYPKTTGLIASPDCTEHTVAKGQRRKGENKNQLELSGMEYQMSPEDIAAERSRCTMWTPLEWAEHKNYEFVILENVTDIRLWKPFDAWLLAWQSLGYDFQLVPINSMHAHPTPQSRDRIYFVAWKRKNKRPDLTITPRGFCIWCQKDVDAMRAWKKPEAWTNYRLQCGKYKQQYVYVCPDCNKEITPYYYAAINAIDWSLPVTKIGDRDKPLAKKTMERIEHGLKKFGLHEQRPMVINTSHSECKHASYIVDSTTAPLPTQTGRQDLALVTPPFVLDHLAEYRPRDITGPLSTICASGNHHSVILPPEWEYWILTYYGKGQFIPIENALPTVAGNDHHAFMTSPIQSSPVTASDCGFRMLEPHEIQMAMAFPHAYILTGNKKERVEMLGNAVTPPVMKLLMQRVVASLGGAA